MPNTIDLLVQAIQFASPQEIPVFVGILPAAMKRYGDAIQPVLKQYPDLFGEYWLTYDYEKNLPLTYHAGKSTDVWGCVWSNAAEGMEAYVTGHPLPNREDILTFKAPAVDAGLPHGFMYLRLLDLRGFDEAMMDFAEEPPELQKMIDVVCDYNVR